MLFFRKYVDSPAGHNSFNDSLVNGSGNNNDSPADVPMLAAVVEPARQPEDDAELGPKSVNNNLPSSKSVQRTPPVARRILLEYEEEEEDEDNLIIVNNQHFILTDSKSAVKIIDTNANEDISDARPIIPDFIASLSSDSDDGAGEMHGGARAAPIGIKGLNGSIKCLSGDDEGLGDISSNASSPNPPMPQVPDDDGDDEDCGKPPLVTKAAAAHLGSPCDERVPSRIPLSVQTNL